MSVNPSKIQLKHFRNAVRGFESDKQDAKFLAIMATASFVLVAPIAYKAYQNHTESLIAKREIQLLLPKFYNRLFH